jgi:hypothetical protein
MYVVTGPAGQGIKINIAILEVLMFLQSLAVTAVAGCDLLICILHRINFDMNCMTGRAVDGLTVV